MDLIKYYTKCPNREGSMAEREFRITRGVLRSERSEFHLPNQGRYFIYCPSGSHLKPLDQRLPARILI